MFDEEGFEDWKEIKKEEEDVEDGKKRRIVVGKKIGKNVGGEENMKSIEEKKGMIEIKGWKGKDIEEEKVSLEKKLGNRRRIEEEEIEEMKGDRVDEVGGVEKKRKEGI